MAKNGSRFGGWLLDTHDNHFKAFSDLTGDGRADVLVTSPWGIGFCRCARVPLQRRSWRRMGTRFGGGC